MVNSPAKSNRNIDERVIAAVKARTPEAVNVRITNIQPKFLRGSLYGLTFETSHNGQTSHWVNRAYVHGKDIEVFGHDEHLLAIVGATHRQGFWDQLSTPQSVTAVVAFAVTILVLFAVGAKILGFAEIDVPEFVSSGFLLILGFYFGKVVESQNKD